MGLTSILGRVPIAGARRAAKRRAELAYWRSRRESEHELRGDHYERFFSDYFGLPRSHYAGKRVLDIGCGPRGTLEWATDADVRIGLDPLADDYLALGADQHAMTYVKGSAEEMPFESAYFDVIASFNSLDHVDSLDVAIAEITRVAKPGGLLLLLTDVGHAPTFTEPQSLHWDVLSKFQPAWEERWSKRIAKSGPGMMESLDADLRTDARESSGYLAALLERNA